MKKRVNVGIQSIKSIICQQNRVLKELMSTVYDASALRAAMLHVNRDLFYVNVYIFHVQNENRERN